MANLDQPRGFEPYGPVIRATVYQSGSACFPGDVVALAADGQVDPALAASTVVGVCLSYASTTNTDVLVADHPDQLFIANASSNNASAQTAIGLMCDLISTAGNTLYQTSRHELNTVGVTNVTATFQILRLEPQVNNAYGDAAKLIVRINEHQLAQGIGIAGI